MSVDLQKLIEEAGLDPKSYILSPPWIGAVWFTAGSLRAEGLMVGYDPDLDNPIMVRFGERSQVKRRSGWRRLPPNLSPFRSRANTKRHNALVPQYCPSSKNCYGLARSKPSPTRSEPMNDTGPDARDFAVIERSDARWARLRELIEQHSLKRGEFTLSSGGKSTYLFQLRQTTMLPEGAKILGDIVVDFMQRHDLRCVGGLAVGAVPMVAAVSVMSAIKAFPVDAFFVRKEAKAHGALERIDGFVSNGAEALLIDDVATSGNSIVKAMEGCKRSIRPVLRARRWW